MRQGPLERFLALGRRSPDHPAVTQEGRTITYGQLGATVLELSATIRASGLENQAAVGEDPVGVAMAPSIDLVTTVLAIQLAGFPCLPLPLDEAPARRRKAIVTDCRPWLVIADASCSGVYAAHSNVATWNDLRRSDLAPVDVDRPGAEDLAYVIYTSGSTGAPKGVDMRWGALANLIAWHVADERLGAAARTAMLTPLTFDVSFQELFGTLATGGTLVVLEPELRRDPVSLLRVLKERNIERLFLPFVALQSLAEAAGSLAVELESLTDVVTAGEQLKITPEIVRFFATLGDTVLHNHYGPSETHVATAEVLTGDPRRWPELPPIGRPIDGVEVAVLDGEGAEAAPGIAGELFIGGECLARGYRNQAQETAARFVPDPRPQHSGRLYRTGDIGKRLDDGRFEWIGRNDDQVKVRGHRVELGGVESVLSRHEGVRQVVVKARRSGASHELVAYVLADPMTETDPHAVAETLDTWRGVWDQTYLEGAGEPDPFFDISGWNSSLTGEPIPVHHMREWVESTVERITSLNPRRVLEVGCGSGLLLNRIAPRCEHYVGLDYSQRVVDRLYGALAKVAGPVPAVCLACAAAHELDQQVDEPVDLVVLNSVLQHFPSPAYLLDVVERAVAVTAPGGKVFIGDVTPHAFREAFHAWLEAPDGPLAEGDRAAAKDRAQRRSALDRELTLDPPFFDLLGAGVPRVARVEVQVRKGKERNELNDFRYDVILHLDDGGESFEGRTLTWSEVGGPDRTIDRLLEHVRSGVCVRGIPNARTRAPWQRAGELYGDDPVQGETFLDPNDLLVAAEQRGIALEVRPDTGHRNLTVGPPGACAPAVIADDILADRSALLRRLSAYASNPLRHRSARELIPRLREFAVQELPDYMRPAAYVLLEALPRTTSGKVDRRRLPSPGHRRPELSTPYAAPRNGLEKTAEEVWRGVLGLDRIGIDDSFFDLGGNSIGVVTLAARLGEVFAQEIPVVTIFEHPTVRSFAAWLDVPAAPAVTPGRGTRGSLTRDAYRHRRNRRVSRGQR